jgi:hypothetical protein
MDHDYSKKTEQTKPEITPIDAQIQETIDKEHQEYADASQVTFHFVSTWNFTEIRTTPYYRPQSSQSSLFSDVSYYNQSFALQDMTQQSYEGLPTRIVLAAIHKVDLNINKTEVNQNLYMYPAERPAVLNLMHILFQRIFPNGRPLGQVIS